jgi:hypothetical protein
MRSLGLGLGHEVLVVEIGDHGVRHLELRSGEMDALTVAIQGDHLVEHGSEPDEPPVQERPGTFVRHQNLRQSRVVANHKRFPFKVVGFPKIAGGEILASLSAESLLTRTGLVPTRSFGVIDSYLSLIPQPVLRYVFSFSSIISVFSFYSS